jgi:hypothetical protein
VAVASVKRNGTRGNAGVSLYCKPWNTVRPKGFLAAVGDSTSRRPSRATTKPASPLSGSAVAALVARQRIDRHADESALRPDGAGRCAVVSCGTTIT